MDSKLDFRVKSKVLTVKSLTETHFQQTSHDLNKLVCEMRRNDRSSYISIFARRLVFTSDGVAVEVVIRSVEI